MIVVVKDTETQHKLAALRDLMIDLATNHQIDEDILNAVAHQSAWGFITGVRVATEAEMDLVEELGPEIIR